MYERARKMEGEKGMKVGGGSKRPGVADRQARQTTSLSLSLPFFFLPLCTNLHTGWNNEQAQCMHYPHNYIYNHYCTVWRADTCSCKHPHSAFVFHNTHIHTHCSVPTPALTPASTSRCYKHIRMEGGMENRSIDKDGKYGWRDEEERKS